MTAEVLGLLMGRGTTKFQQVGEFANMESVSNED